MQNERVNLHDECVLAYGLAMMTDAVRTALHILCIYSLIIPGAGNVCVVMELMQYYVAPEIEILEVVPEGLLCGSNETVDENDGEW